MSKNPVKGLWDKVGKAKGSDADVWKNVGQQVAEQPAFDSTFQLGIWKALAVQPGGMWRVLGDETILDTPEAAGVWEDALEETIILDEDNLAVWGNIDNLLTELELQGDVDMWQEVGEETIILDEPTKNLWEEARGLPDFIEMQPKRSLGYAIKAIQPHVGDMYYILKNLRINAYMRLTEQQFFLWDLMDGENSLQDIAVAYMSEFGSLDINLLVDLLGRLEKNGFLTSERQNIYGELDQNMSQRGIRYYGKKVIDFLMQHEFPLKNSDRFFTKTYNAGIKIFYTKPAQILFLIISVLGLIAFGLMATSGQYSVFLGGMTSLSLGVLGLYAARTVALFIHEGGHAYTTKHYGREIRKAGVMIYYGSFAFYIDSTDIWLESRFPRIMASWGGPYTGFIIGGLASIFGVLSPWKAINGWLYQFTCLLLLDSVMNLNPLMKWDGYYILMDILETHNLRQRAMNFYKNLTPLKKLRKREKFSREDKIFTVYGLATIAWTLFAVVSMLMFFGVAIIDFIVNKITIPVFGIIVVVVILFMFRSRIKMILNRVIGGLVRRLRTAR